MTQILKVGIISVLILVFSLRKGKKSKICTVPVKIVRSCTPLNFWAIHAAVVKNYQVKGKHTLEFSFFFFSFIPELLCEFSFLPKLSPNVNGNTPQLSMNNR